jgi:hypothetical protein
MVYAFWLARGLVIPQAASKEAPLPGARLGYSMAVTLEEKLELVQLLLLQESELDWAGTLAPQDTEQPTIAGAGVVFS